MQSRHETGDEIRVVLRGLPNTGKSSLLNALASDAVALVSDVAGTTRDYVSCTLDLHGLTVQLIDTAGREEQSAAADELQAAAQSMMARQSEQADLELLCLDSTRPLEEWEREQVSQPAHRPRLIVLTKTDLASTAAAAHVAEPPCDGVRTSSQTGQGLAELRRRIAAWAADTDRHGQCVSATAARCRQSVEGAARSIERASAMARRDEGEELVAAELRLALDELGSVVGAIYTDDILDRVFSRFCIGK